MTRVTRMMATAVDSRDSDPGIAPKLGKPKSKNWERATFTIRVGKK